MDLVEHSCECGNVKVIGPRGWIHALRCWNCPEQPPARATLRLVKGEK